MATEVFLLLLGFASISLALFQGRMNVSLTSASYTSVIESTSVCHCRNYCSVQSDCSAFTLDYKTTDIVDCYLSNNAAQDLKLEVKPSSWTFCSNECPRCAAPFDIDAGTAGCIHINHTGMTFDEARRYCQGQGGDLASPVDLNALRPHLTGSTDYWVGVKSRRWFSGRATLTDEWGAGQPNDAPDACGRATAYFSFLLADVGCGATFKVACGLW
ncbi:uncharacterized protein LOC122254210 [Penaeus japonicus]|uniref:uncharacterized protein LOC122254210 n=1 Tax=Penaeus japonicus TaxID=27405 RepID=UPI001C713E48|nr:uncharacterized protein LOC122254210 [Penaeus japonicus]